MSIQFPCLLSPTKVTQYFSNRKPLGLTNTPTFKKSNRKSHYQSKPFTIQRELNSSVMP